MTTIKRDQKINSAHFQSRRQVLATILRTRSNSTNSMQEKVDLLSVLNRLWNPDYLDVIEEYMVDGDANKLERECYCIGRATGCPMASRC